MTDFQKTAIRVALTKLFVHDSFFSISRLKSCLELAKVKLTEDEDALLSALHCCDYSSMHYAFRQELFNRVISLFGEGPQEGLDMATAIQELVFAGLPVVTAKDRLIVALRNDREAVPVTNRF